MKILNINKFYYQRRGAEKYYFDLTKLLESKGHQVIPFSMKDKRNQETPYSKYFVSHLELGQAGKGNLMKQAKDAGRIVYSFEAKKKIQQLLKKETFDLAHIHLIYHHISPSILKPLKKAGIPIVMTLHDYKMICPNFILYTQGDVCNRCNQYRFYNAVFHKCLKDSRLVSFVAMIEMYVHKILKLYERNVDIFIAPSNFVKDKMVEFGQNPDKIVVIPHFIEMKDMKIQSSEKNDKPYLLYAGALSKEKGIDKFVEYYYSCKNSIDFKVAGDGALLSKIESFISKNKISNIHLLGRLNREELEREMLGSLAVVVPSVVYETFGLAALEAFQCKKPVLASNLGGLKELVKDDERGYLFDMNDEKDVIDVLDRAFKDPKRLEEMGNNGWEWIQDRFTPDHHYEKLMLIYNKLMKK